MSTPTAWKLTVSLLFGIAKDLVAEAVFTPLSTVPTKREAMSFFTAILNPCPPILDDMLEAFHPSLDMSKLTEADRHILDHMPKL